jgi:tetratricopeptide (TPR) repeat protein
MKIGPSRLFDPLCAGYSCFAIFATRIMLEPIQQKSWPRADRRAWSLSLSLFLFVIGFAITAWMKGRSWTYQSSLEYIPKEINIKAYEIGSDLMEFSLTLPNYAFGEYFTITRILPETWLYSPFVFLFILAFSLLATAVSYFEDIWFYLCLGVLGLGVMIFGVEGFSPFGIMSKWISGLSVLLVAGPVYLIQAWLPNWNLARRWWVLLFWFSAMAALALFTNFNAAESSLIVAELWYPLLICSLLFIILNSTDVLQGMLILLTKEENNTQSWLHFTVFSFLYLSNYILIYLKNAGLFTLDIFYLNPFALQLATLIFGFWMLEKKAELHSSENQRNTAFSTLYSSLAILFCLTSGLSFAVANDLMIEVLEDAITLIHFCMGVSFFLYVLINYFQLMGMGLRVHLVMFKPRYMPVSAIPVVGLMGVFILVLNSGYFPYYQSLSARQILLADHYRHAQDSFLAENHLKTALSLESRNQRGNLSLAGLYYELGNPAKAQELAQASLDKLASPEAYLAMAQIYRQKDLPLYEMLQLREAVSRFPEEGRILNNIGISFTETIAKDSALYYFSRASESSEAAQVGKSNLGFYYLTNKLEKEGLPKKTPESEQYGDWAQLNNNLVFANVASEAAASLSDVSRKFDQMPEAMQPFILYHAFINKAITRDTTGNSLLMSLENDSIRKYYGDDIAMGKGIMKYRCGKTFEGIDDLLRLYTVSSSNRSVLALLLGQVYYDQGAYTTAASYFKTAANSGFSQAHYWFALSCLDAGRKSEATEAFKESLRYLNAADKVRITVLIDGLSSGKFHNAAQRSDPEKSAFLKINWNSLTDKEIQDLIYLISDKEAQRFLWKYAFDRAYKESMVARCGSLFTFGTRNFGKAKKWKFFLDDARPLVKEIGADFKGLIALREKGELAGKSFLLARTYEHEKNQEKAISLFTQAIADNPTNTRQVGYSIHYLSQQPGLKDFAYQKALDVSDLDPGNVEFLKLYGLLSIRMGLDEFAYAIVTKIEILTTALVAADFKKVLDAELKAKNYPTVTTTIP